MSDAPGSDVSDTVQPFVIDVADDVLDDLRRRLRHTRWPEAELVDGWSQGTPMAMGVAPTSATTRPNAAEQRAIERAEHYRRWDSGYSKQQSTRPQTVGYGLVDCPAGQAAWILEKFWAWTDCEGHPENVLTRDELLDNVMLYWVPATGASSARLYRESFRRPPGAPVTVPTGVASFPHEIVSPVRARVEEAFPNLVHWSEHDRGGHFAAFEVPDRFVEELRTFVRRVDAAPSR